MRWALKASAIVYVYYVCRLHEDARPFIWTADTVTFLGKTTPKCLAVSQKPGYQQN